MLNLRTVVLLCGVAALVGCKTGPLPDTPVVNVKDMAESMSGKTGKDAEDVVLLFPKGTRLPIRISVNTPFMKAEAAERPASNVVFDRDVYWYPRRPERISFNGKDWTKITKLYKGNVRFGVKQTKGKGAETFFSMELQASK